MKPQLNQAQRQELVAALKQGPEAFGYQTPLWTSARVGHAVEEKFSIQYHSGRVWRILRQLNWSPQRPVGRALERNEAAIADWHRCRTWVPRGQTPVLFHHFDWQTISVIAGLTLWNFYFELFTETIRGPHVIVFLEHLQRVLRGPLLVVWDGLPAHRSTLVGEYLHTLGGRIVAERFPAYAPELNPVEYIWAYLKQHEPDQRLPQGSLAARLRRSPRPEAHPRKTYFFLGA
jgi:hypothetical protein